MSILYTLQASLGLITFNIEDIPMAINALFYLFLFVIIIYLCRLDKVKVFKGLVSPKITIIGQIIIVIASMATVDGVLIFVLVSLVVIVLGFVNKLSDEFISICCLIYYSNSAFYGFQIWY